MKKLLTLAVDDNGEFVLALDEHGNEIHREKIARDVFGDDREDVAVADAMKRAVYDAPWEM